MNIFIAIIFLLIVTTHVSAKEVDVPFSPKHPQTVMLLQETIEIDPIIHQLQLIKKEKGFYERRVLSNTLFDHLKIQDSDHTDKIINEIFFANPTGSEIGKPLQKYFKKKLKLCNPSLILGFFESCITYQLLLNKLAQYNPVFQQKLASHYFDFYISIDPQLPHYKAELAEWFKIMPDSCRQYIFANFMEENCKKNKESLVLSQQKLLGSSSRMIINPHMLLSPELLSMRDSLIEEVLFSKKAPYKKVICNHSGFDFIDVDFSQETIVKGPALKDNGIALDWISYNFHVPYNIPQGIVVRFYGGLNIQSRKALTFVPGLLSSLDKYFLKKDFAVVTLNLIDLLEETELQQEMTEDMNHRILKSVIQFWQGLKKESVLSQFIFKSTGVDITKLPIFLTGNSFGGRNTVYVAEQYPGTFSGYIPTSPALVDCEDFDAVPYKLPSPVLGINLIQDPVHIIHNFSDNSVSLKSTLAFLDNIPEQKQSLFSFFISPYASVNETDPRNIGHHFPEHCGYFKCVAESALFFMKGVIESTQKESSVYTRMTPVFSKEIWHILGRQISFQEDIIEKFCRLHKEVTPSKEEFETLVRSVHTQFADYFLSNALSFYIHAKTNPLDFQQHPEFFTSPCNDVVWKECFLPIFCELYFYDIHRGNKVYFPDEKSTHDKKPQMAYKSSFLIKTPLVLILDGIFNPSDSKLEAIFPVFKTFFKLFQKKFQYFIKDEKGMKEKDELFKNFTQFFMNNFDNKVGDSLTKTVFTVKSSPYKRDSHKITILEHLAVQAFAIHLACQHQTFLFELTVPFQKELQGIIKKIAKPRTSIS